MSEEKREASPSDKAWSNGPKIETLRDKKKWKQTTLADRAHCSERFIIYLERPGGHLTTRRYLDKVAQALEVPVEEIIDASKPVTDEPRIEPQYPVSQFNHLPPEPPSLVGRDQALGEVKQLIGITPCCTELSLSAGLVIIRGWPGVGKSALAAALAHDGEVHAFYEGILWVQLGQTPDVRAGLVAWSKVVGSDVDRFDSLDHVGNALASRLKNLRLLLVVDDAWGAGDANRFLFRGSKHTAIVTTRENEVADELDAPKQIHPLTVLDEESALQLLEQNCGRLATEHEPECRELVRSLERLPLALIVAGRLLYTQKVRHAIGVIELLKELQTSAQRLMGEPAPFGVSSLPEKARPTIAALLQQSVGRLGGKAQACFKRLGVVEAKSRISLRTLKAWWKQDPTPIVNELIDRGLLEPSGKGYYQIHAILRDYAKYLLEQGKE